MLSCARSSRVLPAYVLLLCLSFVTVQAYANPYRLAHTFYPANSETGDLFGTAVAMEGNVVAIKSDSGFFDGNGLSVTHIFEQDSVGDWTEAATLENDSGENAGNPFLGSEIALHSGELVIGYGLEFTDPSTPALQFATRSEDGWFVRFNEGRDLSNPLDFAEPESRTRGRSVDISGNIAVADDSGARRKDGGRGVVRVYEKQLNGQWEEAANLVPAGLEDFVPTGLAIDGTTVAVSIQQTGPSTSPGDGLYFFEMQPDGHWLETQAIIDFEFPLHSTKMHGDTLLVVEGVQLTSFTIPHFDVVVYERTDAEWEETQRFPKSTYSQQGFALEGDIVAISSEDDPSRVDVYRLSAPGEWALQTSVFDPDPTQGLEFGSSLEFDQGRLLVGASSVDQGLLDPPGVAYLFVPVPEPNSLAIAGVILMSGLVRRMGAAVRFTRNT